MKRIPAKESDLLENDVDAPAWREAKVQLVDLKTLLAEGELTDDLAKVLAEKWQTSKRTVWRRVRAFRKEGGIGALLRGRRGPERGARRIDVDAEAVIADSARQWWKDSDSATIAEIYPTIVQVCRAREIPVPSRATVARRLSTLKLDPANFSGSTARVLRERTLLVKERYHVERPLAVVQVDHTVADVFIVDPVSRISIGRPTLTVAIDVATRCVLGFCLSLEAPSSLLVALCLEQAVFPKTEYLKRASVDIDWPMFGLPAALHVDDGREFHSAAFRRGCDLNGIDTIYRPPATPRFGGHVERLIGTLMRRIRLLPGNSYSDLLRARPSRAEAKATLILSELGGFLLEDISRYHGNKHRSLGLPPRLAWESRCASLNVAPRLPPDPTRFRREFLPMHRRVIGREGIELFGLKYSCEALACEVRTSLRRVVRFDPRDLSQVYLERDRAEPLAVPLRDKVIPAMSIWEWNRLRKAKPQCQLADGHTVRAALAQASHAVDPVSTKLRARRLSARKGVWRELQKIAAMPGPDTTLETTMSSSDIGSFSWEVLE